MPVCQSWKVLLDLLLRGTQAAGQHRKVVVHVQYSVPVFIQPVTLSHSADRNQFAHTVVHKLASSTVYFPSHRQDMLVLISR